MPRGTFLQGGVDKHAGGQMRVKMGWMCEPRKDPRESVMPRHFSWELSTGEQETTSAHALVGMEGTDPNGQMPALTQGVP